MSFIFHKNYVSTSSAVSPATTSLIKAGSESWSDLTDEEEKRISQLKFEMTAIPVGMAMMAPRVIRPGVKGRKVPRNGLTSKSYNIVAERPLAMKINRMKHYVANLRYDLVAPFITSTIAEVYDAKNFTLSSFSQYANYTSLFDQYKFDLIEVWFENQNSNGATTVNTGQMCTAIDVDDSNTPTSFAQVEAHQSSLTTAGQAGHYHKWEPHMAVAVYSGAFTSFANQPAGWLDVASPNVQHYGLKFASRATSVALSYNLSVRARIIFRQAGI